ncbi:acylglycerol kinase, mitochondrial [Stomoxys calcitrans]|uniref:acylglycerol kinase, mitochondrial n=1 Tax=Stomoxys calcitrans TaxID=35570 RepID=UPI0027E28559|nr:acylglycerol kinase, mitochondrial [Stomoxys calcitrans]
MGVFQFCRNHWKKLTFASVVAGYGANYVWTEHQITSHMQQVCRSLPEIASSRPYRAVVVINPVANDKKCEKIFRKYCEPILHLAGYSVEVVKTKEIGSAKSLIESLPTLPDVLVIAGGDGTSSEVVTGLLRRKDEPCPILLLPLGERNETVSAFLPVDSKKKVEYVKCLSSCVVSLVQERLRYRNVLKYEVLPDENDPEPHRPIYGLQRFSWGLVRDIEAKKDKYWYFGFLRHQASALATSFSNEMSRNITAMLTCTPPCPGCTKCAETKTHTQRVFKKLFSPKTATPVAALTVANDSCGLKEQHQVQAKQVDIVNVQNEKNFSELHTQVIESIDSGLDFIMHIKEKMEPSLLLKSRTVEIIPKDMDMPTYAIDGEEYDARAVKISLLPNAIKCYC